MISAALLVATTAVASPALGQDTAHTVTRDGVTLPREVDVAGHHLVLNGTALRKKFIVKVYVAALYLPTKQSDADQILAADQPRRVTLQFVHDVDKEKMCNAWNEAL